MTIEELYLLAKKEGFEKSTILTESIDALISDDLQIEHLTYNDEKCVLLSSDRCALDGELQLESRKESFTFSRENDIIEIY